MEEEEKAILFLVKSNSQEWMWRLGHDVIWCYFTDARELNWNNIKIFDTFSIFQKLIKFRDNNFSQGTSFVYDVTSNKSTHCAITADKTRGPLTKPLRKHRITLE